jgi:hypothetical protein
MNFLSLPDTIQTTNTTIRSDSWFYSVPKLVYHIDEPAVAALTQYYRNNIPPKSDILDICSSWVSYVKKNSWLLLSNIYILWNLALLEKQAHTINHPCIVPFFSLLLETVTIHSNFPKP